MHAVLGTKDAGSVLSKPGCGTTRARGPVGTHASSPCCTKDGRAGNRPCGEQMGCIATQAHRHLPSCGFLYRRVHVYVPSVGSACPGDVLCGQLMPQHPPWLRFPGAFLVHMSSADAVGKSFLPSGLRAGSSAPASAFLLPREGSALSRDTGQRWGGGSRKETLRWWKGLPGFLGAEGRGMWAGKVGRELAGRLSGSPWLCPAWAPLLQHQIAAAESHGSSRADRRLLQPICKPARSRAKYWDHRWDPPVCPVTCSDVPLLCRPWPMPPALYHPPKSTCSEGCDCT